MSDNKARGFLEDILHDPDNDQLRLIYADWLEETGSLARAEFIRTQIERASLPVWDPRQLPLKLREKELLGSHEHKWKRDLPNVAGVTWREFRRGFVATAEFSSFGTLALVAKECWDATPLEAVVLQWYPSRDFLQHSPAIDNLRELSIYSGYVGPADAEQFANAPILSTLRSFYLPSAQLGTAGFQSLLSSPHLGNLKKLLMPCNGIGNDGIGALQNAESLGALEELDLSDHDTYERYSDDPVIAEKGMCELAEWSGLKHLRSLNLSGNKFTKDGLDALLQSRFIRGLKKLNLRTCDLQSEDLRGFVDAHDGLQLDELDLGDNLLRDAGLAHLADATCLEDLKVLNLDQCEIGVDGMRNLTTGASLANLHMLNLNYNPLGAEGLRTLWRRSHEKLHTLHLVDADIDDNGVSQLADAPASSTLQELDLSRNSCGDKAARALAKAKHLEKLLVLRLNSVELGQHALITLSNSDLGKRLSVLENQDDDIPF